MTRAASAGCASPATPNTASRRAAARATASSGWCPIARSSSPSPARQPRLGTGRWVPRRPRPRAATGMSTAHSASTSSPKRRRRSSPAWTSSTLRRETPPTSRLGLSAACRISSPPTGDCSATGTTSTSRGRLWWRRTRFAPRPCSRRSSRSNHDEASRMMKSPLLALATALTLAAPAAAQVKLNGAGATFPNIIYQDWMLSYNQAHPDVQLNYQSIGSGGGIRQFSDGTVDFGATDAPMKDSAIAAIKGNVLHIPTVLGGDVPTYNLPDVKETLRFTPDVLADIFLGKITKWSDARITAVNPGVKLPATDVVVVHRSDGSGTSFIWTDYLSKVSKEWEMKVGRGTSVNWPVGLGGKGNEGVSGQVQQTPNSIGYVELIYAVQNKMKTGKVKNATGAFVAASLAGVTAAAASSKEMPDDFRVSITNAPGKDAYPISSFTWLLIPERIADATKKKAIKDFLNWMLTDGQNMTEALAYARLPKSVV